MKVIFTIITILGMAYLAWSSIDKFSHTVQPQNTALNNNSDTAAEKPAQSTLEQDIEALQKNIRELEHKQFEMQASLERLLNMQGNSDKIERGATSSAMVQESLAATNNATVSDTALASSVDSKEAAKANYNAVFQGLETPQGVDLTTLGSKPSSTSAEQQKRLAQQAQLRDIANKRQFAALETLSARK